MSERCACPMRDARSCIEVRSRPDWDTAGNWTEPDERCDCMCHDDQDDEEDEERAA